MISDMVPKSNVVLDSTYNNVYDIAYDNVCDVVSNVISDIVSNVGIFNRVIKYCFQWICFDKLFSCTNRTSWQTNQI